MGFRRDLYGGSPRCCCCRCSWVDTLQPEGHTSSAPSALVLPGKHTLYCLWCHRDAFNVTYDEGWEGKAIKRNRENWGKTGDRQVCCWHSGWGWSVMEHVSRKGRTKGLQGEERLTVYYYRKLNQVDTNAVYTILPLITPPLLHWPFGWLHPLRGGDSSTAISSELSCRLLITMLLLLMAFITVSVFYVRLFFFLNQLWHEIQLWPGISPPTASWHEGNVNVNKSTCICALYLMISRIDITKSAIKDPWSSPPLRVGVLMWAHRCRRNLSFAHLGHWAPSCGRGPCTG